MGNKVSENIGKEISAKVTKVEANGLYFQLESGDQAFLPKENMHVGKKKKLTEIFSEGFVVNAKIKNIKKDKVILTQKEKVDSTPKTVEATKAKHNKKKPKKLNQDSVKKDKESKINEQPKQPKQEENVQEEPKQKTLKDLKKLQYIGNMKISVGRGKKSNLTKLAEEKEEVIELPKVPDGLLDDIITSTAEATEKFSKLVEDLKERSLLEEGGR
ncbi:S1 RNA-binding domain-containing protein [Gemella sp. 27098_8_92]|uniref:S1 RNA-binding domain-containing protein n=1 Tax=Gemella sp. 27098_8_92 TaxID=3003687 RepID=UPI00352E3779